MSRKFSFDIHRWGIPLLFVLVGLLLSVVHRGVRFDDPFITYRYALNLAEGRGFVFNAGQATLITTAPLYALLLALAHLLGVAPPTSSPLISVAGLIVGACTLWEYGRARHPVAAFAAGLLFLTAPLAWLTIGFETPLFLAVSLGALLAARRGRLIASGALAAAAIGLRGDGLLMAGLIGLLLLRSAGDRGKRLSRFVVPIVLLYGTLAVWLTMQFGTPIPSTLQTKAAQAVSGLTGFYPFTTYPEGASILLRAWFEQNPIFAAAPLLAATGLAALMRSIWKSPLDEEVWHAAAPAVWALAHAMGYAILGVAPYVWYYAPLVPGLAWLAGLGIEAASKQTPRRLVFVASFVGAALITGPAHWHAGQLLRGAVPPAIESPTAKVLPEAKVDIYERAGRWIAAHTPMTASIGVSELGVMSYYSERHADDFLGLTRPRAIAEIRRGDFEAAVLRVMPQYMLLPMRNSVYDIDPQQEPWFSLLYRPVQRFEDQRFWGSPLTIWQLTSERPVFHGLPGWTAAPPALDGWRIEAVESSVDDLSALPPGKQPLLLRALLRAPQDGAHHGNRTLRMQPIFADGGDGLQVVSRLIHTNAWQPGESGWVDFPATVYRPTQAAAYMIEFTWLDAPETRAPAAVLAAQPQPPATLPPLIDLSQGYAVAAVTPNSATSLLTGTLYWRAGVNGALPFAHAFVHVRNERGETVAQDDHVPRHRGATFPTTAWKYSCLYEDHFVIALPQDLPSGRYQLVVGLYDPASGQRLTVNPGPHRTDDGGVRVAEVAVTVR